MPTIPYELVREELLADPEVKREYDALDALKDEFAMLARAIDARAAAGKTQAQVAAEMGVSQPAVAKIEAGKVKSLDSLRRYAAAVGCKIRIEFVRVDGK